MTETTNADELEQNASFRENLRRQLLAKGAEGTPEPNDSYVPMVQLDPSEGRAVRWFGSVVGGLLFVFGAVWILAILGYTVPWYAVFPILAMFVASISSPQPSPPGRSPSGRGCKHDRCDHQGHR